jgi:GAF domain-containing protein
MDRLQMLLDVSGILSSNWNPQQSFPRISARIRRVLNHEYAGFELRDNSTGLLVRQVEDFPLGKGLVSARNIETNNSPGGRSLQQGAPLIFSKEQIQGFEAEIAQSFLAEGLQSLCCVPLLRPQGALGVLVLGSTRDDAFQPEDLILLNQLAAQLAIALENHRGVLPTRGNTWKERSPRQDLLPRSWGKAPRFVRYSTRSRLSPPATPRS